MNTVGTFLKFCCYIWRRYLVVIASPIWVITMNVIVCSMIWLTWINVWKNITK